MINRPFYTLKFNSGRLKEFDYNINITFEKAKDLKEVIALSDSQILRSIRDIRGFNFDNNDLEALIYKRDKIKRQKNSLNNSKLINQLQTQINNMLFIQDYITIVMEHPSHYKYIYENGVIINGNEFRRLSCSAGQARVSTVVLCNVEIIDELKRRLNNGRNLNIPLAPSKYNAYFGLAGSATKLVSEPKFIVIKDFENTVNFRANYVIETDWDFDDEIIEKEITDMPMNRTDGMGLIRPEKSKQWAEELGLDYIPSQWCVRQNFIKGMLCTFPIQQFCDEINGGNYIVDTIYKDANGDYIKADLRDCDIILTESQFKLWDSYNNLDEYIKNCHENKLYWGVSQYTPKEAKNILNLNYQFIQTLDLDKKDICILSEQFIEWIKGVSYENIPYTLLFLIGTDCNEEKILQYLEYSDCWWVKALIVNHSLIEDKYIKTKIRDMLKVRSCNACMGDIIVDGNFQVIVSDPYAFMQHVCNLPITGLLQKDEFYSNYWNERGITQVDSMRSPLTYRSEHVVLNLKKDEITKKWYRYCKLGVIVNWFGHESVRWAGSDFDFDLISTTSNSTMIKSVYRDELPIVYAPPKPQKILFTEDDLYKADTFGFGSIIGSITNKSSNGYAILPNIITEYGKDSEEYKLLISRLKQCCKAQSAQIDKSKIGREVKGIPKIWLEKSDNETMNHVLLNKYPYFFKYRYKNAKIDYKNYLEKNNLACIYKFKMPIDDLLMLNEKNTEQKTFLENFYTYMPLTFSESPMNLLCMHLEKTNTEIQKNIRNNKDIDFTELYKNKEHLYTNDQYKKIIDCIKRKHNRWENTNEHFDGIDAPELYDEKLSKNSKLFIKHVEDEILKICSDVYIITNCLVDYYYRERPTANKDFLWGLCGEYIFENIKRNTNMPIMIPSLNCNGDILYLGKKYKMREVKNDKQLL